MKNAILLTISMLAIAGIVWAAESCGDAGMSMSASQPAVSSTTSTPANNVGNKICPVSGAKVDGVTKVTYEGKEYNLCSSACMAAFNKDPQTYVKKVEDELKAEAAAATAATPAANEPAAATK
ncbi:MAG TPA: YHS domain-containing protein [Patescibacteria group bacterium]|nr:YHS domain-containing protein [Patescibacteria group bacterium]